MNTLQNIHTRTEHTPLLKANFASLWRTQQVGAINEGPDLAAAQQANHDSLDTNLSLGAQQLVLSFSTDR